MGNQVHVVLGETTPAVLLWWPPSRDLAAELPPLLAALGARLGDILR
ncbi:DUF5994 family protein [Lentzea kristufekii]